MRINMCLELICVRIDMSRHMQTRSMLMSTLTDEVYTHHMLIHTDQFCIDAWSMHKETRTVHICKDAYMHM